MKRRATLMVKEIRWWILRYDKAARASEIVATISAPNAPAAMLEHYKRDESAKSDRMLFVRREGDKSVRLKTES